MLQIKLNAHLEPYVEPYVSSEFWYSKEREKLVRGAVAARGNDGDLVVSVCAEIGSHAVMLDGVSEEVDSKTDIRKTFAHVREPFNRARLKVDADYFFRISSSALVIHPPASQNLSVSDVFK